MPTPRRFFFQFDQAHRAMLAHANREMLAAVGVTSAQLAVLHLVHERPGGSAADVARALRVRKSAMSGVLARLDDAGLVRRSADDGDGRRAVLSLTARGERVRVASRATTASLQRELLEELDAAELATIERFLARTIARYGAAAAADVDAAAAAHGEAVR